MAVNLILRQILDNKQNKKRQMVFDKIWPVRTKYFHLDKNAKASFQVISKAV